jgi:hypothetical protein
MISALLAKLYGIILEKKINRWLKNHRKGAKGQGGLKMLRIIAEECHNIKTNILCCFVDFRKYFDKVPVTNLWNRLKEIKVPFELRVCAIRLYMNIIAKFRNT